MFSHKAFTKSIAALGLCVSLMGMMLLAQPVSADITIPSDYGIGTVATNANLEKEGSIPVITGRIVGAALSLIGVAFFILMVYAGFLWMSAHGNEEQVKKAQSTLIGASVGMLIILSSYAITKFIFESVESTAGGDAGRGGNQVPEPIGGAGAGNANDRCRAAWPTYTCKPANTCLGVPINPAEIPEWCGQDGPDGPNCAPNLCEGENITCCE
ncbi:MAG: hypothetical protein KBD15_04195 [Candidatus Magasanikbacteria bacterium]|nr:hypothetical protein [Candidatus Magasanikbacteria bacterium]